MNGRKVLILISTVVVLMTVAQSFAVIDHHTATPNVVASPSYNGGNSSNSFYGSAVSNNSITTRGGYGGFYLSNGSKVPSKYIYLPNMHPSLENKNGALIPSYSSSPAPMGIGDYGVYNNSSKLVSYSYYTSSFEGSISVTNMTPLYVLNDAPQSLGIQLNAILNNVTVGSASNNAYWTQNVMLYSARTHQIQFIDNIWNFSSPGAGMTNSTLSGHGSRGTLVPNSLYYAIGPAINVTYPFKVNLYLNSTLSGGSDEIFFNYSVSSQAQGGKTVTGSYDNATFNSTTSAANPAYYYISGNQYAPIGGIPYDAEFVIGGPGGGSTTSLYGMNATMGLRYLSQSTGSYQNVKSAYDAGSSTGETSNGIAVSWNSKDQAVLTPGPSIVYGMWGISNSKMNRFSGKISPSESFLFVSNSLSFNNTTSSWAPLARNGSYSFSLPVGPYSAGVFSNWNNPVYESLSNIAGQTVTLHSNSSMGVYAPIYIFGNRQLSDVSSAGSGTAGSPYIVTGSQNGSMMPVFGKFNDYAFPVFSGLLVSGTSAHAYFSSLPSFYIYYSQDLQAFLNYYGLPSVNYLNMEFYNDSNVAILNSSFISGWFSTNLAGFFPAANLLLWNVTNSIIASNYFSSMDSSLLIYNHNSTNSNVTVWGNYFKQDSLASSSLYYSINVMGAPSGLALFSSGDLVYNNVFDVYFTAISPGISIYSGSSVNYTDMWNISREPTTYYREVLGLNLTGGIMSSGPNGIEYQAGNYWWNYIGNGSIVYNNSGLIHKGGDMQPLIYHVYRITFSETGLPSGMSWLLYIGTSPVVIRGNGSSISFYEPNGTYFIQIYANGYLANQSSGFVIVSGKGQSFNLVFRQLFLLTFIETGLSQEGTAWSITVNGVTGYSTTNTVEYLATNGSYRYNVSSVGSYYPEQVSGTFTIYGANTTVNVRYLPFTYPVTFRETGLAAGTEWGIFSDGQKSIVRSQSISLNLPNGTYSYSVIGAKGYLPDNPYGTVQVDNGSSMVSLIFRSANYTLTFTQSGLPSGAAWSVTVGGTKLTSTNRSASIQESTGIYNYSITGPSGYVASQGAGSVDVNANISVPVNFKSAGPISLLHVFDYALFGVSIAVLAYAVYTVRKRS